MVQEDNISKLKVPCSKKTFTPKVADISKRIFLLHLDLCYVSPFYYKLKDLSSIVDCEPFRSIKNFFS